MLHNKLVRDKIPEYLKNKSIKSITHIATDEEYKVELRKKLQEEVDEFLEDPCIEELADILEVVNALCDMYDFDRDELEKVRCGKADKRGGFKEKIILDKTVETK